MKTTPHTTIWLVRHGERVDNVDATWCTRAPRGAWDDPPLTDRGLQQALECGRRLSTERIDYIFCSPFMRCVQTANAIAAQFPRPIAIYIEPGLCETLYVCQNPPGNLPTAELHRLFPVIDPTYEAIIPHPAPEIRSEEGCIPRMRIAINGIRAKYHGNLLMVSHGAPIAAGHAVLTGQWHYVGQCTLSQFLPLPSDIRARLPPPLPDNTGQAMAEFHAVMSGDSRHLSDRTNLRGRDDDPSEMKMEKRGDRNKNIFWETRFNPKDENRPLVAMPLTSCANL